MTSLRSFAVLLVVGAALTLNACGGGGSGNPPIMVSFSTAPPSSLATSGSASMAALVANDPSGNGVTWSATCSGGNGCGGFTQTNTANGDPTSYTAPTQVPNPATVTITATSVSDASATATAKVTITGPAAPVLADGTYIFHLSGQDSIGPYGIAGAFTVANGKITAGEQDFTDPNAGYTDSLVVANCSVNSVGGNIQIVLATGNTAIGVNGVETLRGTVVSATRVLLTEFDLTAGGTGSLDLQTSTAAPAGGYAFAISGSNTQGNAISIGGVFAVNGIALDVAGSVFDQSIFGSNGVASVLQKQTFTSGSVSAPDDLGRVLITLTPSAASGVPTFVLAGYITGTNRIELVESAQQGDVLNANNAGSALGQGANTGTFTATSPSVLGQSYAQGSGGIDANGPAIFSGAFALNAGSVLGGRLAVNDLTNIGAWTMGGTYTVDATGRVTVSVTSLTSQTAAPPAPALTFELYLDGNGNAMVMGADTFETTQGIAFEQGGAFTLAGPYALSAQGAAPGAGNSVIAFGAVGPVTVSNDNFSGYTDFNGVTPQSNVTLSGSANTTTGVLTLTGLNPNSPSVSDGFGYYPVSGNRLWALQVDDNGIALLLMEGVQ
jgi:hypothetical protein